MVALAVQGERVNETLSDGFKAFEGAVVDQGREVAQALAARGGHIAKELADHLQLFERSLLRDGGALTERIDEHAQNLSERIGESLGAVDDVISGARLRRRREIDRAGTQCDDARRRDGRAPRVGVGASRHASRRRLAPDRREHRRTTSGYRRDDHDARRRAGRTPRVGVGDPRHASRRRLAPDRREHRRTTSGYRRDDHDARRRAGRTPRVGVGDSRHASRRRLAPDRREHRRTTSGYRRDDRDARRRDGRAPRVGVGRLTARLEDASRHISQNVGGHLGALEQTITRRGEALVERLASSRKISRRASTTPRAISARTSADSFRRSRSRSRGAAKRWWSVSPRSRRLWPRVSTTPRAISARTSANIFTPSGRRSRGAAKRWWSASPPSSEQIASRLGDNSRHFGEELDGKLRVIEETIVERGGRLVETLDAQGVAASRRLGETADKISTEVVRGIAVDRRRHRQQGRRAGRQARRSRDEHRQRARRENRRLRKYVELAPAGDRRPDRLAGRPSRRGARGRREEASRHAGQARHRRGARLQRGRADDDGRAGGQDQGDRRNPGLAARASLRPRSTAGRGRWTRRCSAAPAR